MLSELRRKIYQAIPDHLKFQASSSWEQLKRGRSYHSHNGEDVVLSKMFPRKTDGFYVDVGAHHPKKYSNTYLLHKQGWSGINIDANPRSIKLFKKYRPSDVNLNIGVGETKGKLDFYEFADPAVNTFSEDQAKEWIENRQWNKYLGKREVLVDTLNNILKEHLPENQEIDLLTIDVEGLDDKIIKSLDMVTYKPKTIIIEDQTFDENNPENSAVYSYLTRNGYKLHVNLSISLIFKI